MTDYDKWGRPLTSSTGGTGGTGGTTYDKWGRVVHTAPSVSGSDLQHIVDTATHGTSFLHSAEGLGTNFLAGLYETGRASTLDVKNNPESLVAGPFAPIFANMISISRGHGGGHLTKEVAIPTGYAYKNKYYGRSGFHPGAALHNIAADPFGTLLDALALGTVPIGGEGLAIRGASLAERVGATDTALGSRIVSLGEKAVKAQEARPIHYIPPGETSLGKTAEGSTFMAPRARTVQGRYLYNPLRDTLGRAAGGTLPYVGDAARLARYNAKTLEFNLGEVRTAAGVREYQKSISADLRGSKRLSRAERIAQTIMTEYGPDSAKAAELGAPRLQRVEFYKQRLAETQQRLEELRGKPRRGNVRATLQAIAGTQKHMIDLYSGNEKLAAKIDEAIKTPRPILEEVIAGADQIAEAGKQILLEKGYTEAQLDERRFAPQYGLHGYSLSLADEEGNRFWTHPDTLTEAVTPTETAAPAAAEPAQLPSVVPTSEPPTFSLRLPRLFYDTIRDKGRLGGHHFETVSRTADYVRVKMNEAAFRHLERVAKTEPQTSTVRSALRRIDKQRGVMEAAVEKTRQKLAWRTDQTGMWHVEGSDYLVVPGEHAYESYHGSEPLGHDRTLPEAKRRVEQDAARLRGEQLQNERRAVSGDDPFMQAIDPQAPATPIEAPPVEAPLVGEPKSLEQIRAEHPDARYYPNLGPDITAEGAKLGAVRRSLSKRLPGVAKRYEGVRLATGTVAHGPQAPIRAFAQLLNFKATALAMEQLKPLMIPVEHDQVLKGYALVNPDAVKISRFQREAQAMHEHLGSLTDEAHATQIREHLDQMFPTSIHPGEDTTHLQQVPESFIKAIRKDYKRANIFVKYLVDKPLAIWKALVLKYRPAWLVNNILGQHVLLLLHHPLFWNDYMHSLSARKRAEFEKGIHGLSMGGTSELIRNDALKNLGFETTRRGRLQSGEIGGIAGKVAYRAVDYPWKVVKGFGDGIAKANLVVADDMTRFTLARHEVKGYARRQRVKELAAEQRAAKGFAEANDTIKQYTVKGVSLEEIARTMPVEAKLEVLRKVNSALGDFNTLHGAGGRRLRRFVPFASWFKVILEISRDLMIEHPEKVWFVYQMEQAAKKNPSVTPSFDVPSWFVGSLIAPWFGTKPGEVPLVSTNTANPFSTPVQLAQQLGSLLHRGAPTGTVSPIASLGPAAEAVNLYQGFDPFYGGSYTGPGDKSPGYQRIALGIAAGLPPVRLANEAGLPLTGKYHQAASYNDRFTNVDGHDIPLDAILRYLGLPLRRANRAKLQEYANRGL